ncbi:hypothetical protein A2U01_0075109 [Trifolium medium]|uniref:Uncharacterized protein n=1 Tax=Trifolium medium TaxID=97028 RepID=A0A392SZE4_9FABA|nr:hypothetical protein [Trifolium medium]
MRLPGSQEKIKKCLKYVNYAQLRRAEPSAGKKKFGGEVLPAVPGMERLELGVGAGICTYKLETQSQN